MKFQMAVVAALFFLTLNRIVTADEGLIAYTCSKTPYKDFCIGALMSDSRSLSRDTAGLGVILIEQLAEKTNQAIKIVKELARRTQDPNVLKALKQCGRNYNAVLVADVPMATEGLTKGNPKFAEQAARDAAGEARTCEEGFPQGTSPVSGLNNEMNMMGEVVASIARLLE